MLIQESPSMHTGSGGIGSPAEATSSMDVSELAARVAHGDDEAAGLLYRLVMPGLKLFFQARRLDISSAEDCAHEAYVEALARVRTGALSNPACFLGYLRTIAYRTYLGHLNRRGREVGSGQEEEWRAPLADRRPGPEETLLDADRRRIAMDVLREMSPREREVLTRFYLWEQDAATICREMGLTETQFRLLKSRAKARFGELGRRRLAPRLAAIVRRPAA